MFKKWKDADRPDTIGLNLKASKLDLIINLLILLKKKYIQFIQE